MKLPKLPFKLTALSGGLSRIFSFSRKEATIIVISVSAVLVVALIITIITLTVSGRATVSVRNNISTDDNEIGRELADRPFLSDFIIYEDNLEESFTGVIYSREPSEKWSSEKVQEYWIDPREIAADQLQTDVEKLVKDIFADVP